MLRLGDPTATGQVLTESVGSELVLDAALKAAPPIPPSAHPTIRRGRGLSLVFHGSGFTGSGEKTLQGTLGLEALRDGTFRILTASTESGAGPETVCCRPAAGA